MKPLTILQALALLLLAVLGASAEDPAAGACPMAADAVTCALSP